MLGRGGMNDEINILNAISLLEHLKSQGWGWPASSQLHGDVGLHPFLPAIPRLPFHAPGEIAAPRGYRLLPPTPSAWGALAPQRQTHRGAVPPLRSHLQPPITAASAGQGR